MHVQCNTSMEEGPSTNIHAQCIIDLAEHDYYGDC